MTTSMNPPQKNKSIVIDAAAANSSEETTFIWWEESIGSRLPSRSVEKDSSAREEPCPQRTAAAQSKWSKNPRPYPAEWLLSAGSTSPPQPPKRQPPGAAF